MENRIIKDVYEMKLHDELITTSNIKITRVPGGWIYLFPDKQPLKVDYNSEFKELQKKIPLDEIIEFVENYYNLPVKIIKTKTKDGNYPIAKQMISSICAKYTVLSSADIAKKLNYASGSSVTCGIKKMRELMTFNTRFVDEYNDILKGLKLL